MWLIHVFRISVSDDTVCAFRKSEQARGVVRVVAIKTIKHWSWVLAAALWLASGEAVPAQTVTFESDMPGQPPRDFEFGLAGEGQPGRWEVVADPTAAG